MRLKIYEKSWHRNGVGGEPFYMIDFKLWDNEDDIDGADLVAVMTERETFVVNPENIFEHFRGDEIGERLRELEDFEF